MTQTPHATAPVPAPVSEKEIRSVYFALMAVLGLGALDQSIVATALPRIVADLGGMAHLSWVVTAYVLASTATMPLYGKMADQYGRRPMIFTALATFLLGSVLCGLAGSMTQLIVFRAIQGIGAGGFMPLAQIIISDLVAPKDRAKRQGSIAIVFAVTSVLGPVLGGLVTDLLSWHWIFFINLPVGAFACWAIARSLRKPVITHAHRIDYLGSILLTTSIVSLLLILALGGTEWPWNALEIKVCAALTVVLGAWLFVHLRRAAEPVLPPDLFGNRVFNLASAVMALSFVGLMGSSVFFPLYFQLVMGSSPAHSGMLTVPMMAGMIVSSALIGRAVARANKYKEVQVIGLAVAVAAFAALTWAMATGPRLPVHRTADLPAGRGPGPGDAEHDHRRAERAAGGAARGRHRHADLLPLARRPARRDRLRRDPGAPAAGPRHRGRGQRRLGHGARSGHARGLPPGHRQHLRRRHRDRAGRAGDPAVHAGRARGGAATPQPVQAE
jgi:EmrB/QacA subfamily drug resistance transporter